MVLFISPPFGNYFPQELINLVFNIETKSITGSFTLEARPGLLRQIEKTLRWTDKYENSGWINKIGFRNQGIDWAIEKYKDNNYNNIISLGIINKNDILKLVDMIPDNLNIEVNVSCPNIDKSYKSSIDIKEIDTFLNKEREWCIVKLPPQISTNEIDQLYLRGWRQFHCSNTLPKDEGGLSGKSVKPYSLKLTSYISKRYPDAEIIGGGGIETIQDIKDYSNAGTQHFSVSSILFNPFKFIILINDFSNKKYLLDSKLL